VGKIRLFVLVLVIFSLGWLMNTFLTNFIYYDAQKPLSVGLGPFTGSPERISPSDHVAEENIHVFNDRVVLDIPGATWASFTDTNSMDPFFDESSNSIELKPASADDIKVGDIISYSSSLTSGLVVHRVIQKGVDDSGVFYIVQGDNNPSRDPEKVRFGQVHGVLVAVIY
jgi:hypothetical protein